MKNWKSIFGMLVLTFVLSSCVILNPKVYKGILADRDNLRFKLQESNTRADSLSTVNTQLKRDTTNLGERLRRVQEQLVATISTFNRFKENASGEIQQLMADLESRESRLREVEDILRKREEANLALQNKLQRALLGFESSGLSIYMKDGKVYVSLTDKLLFDTGSIVIDARGRTALTELAKVLQEQSDIVIMVEGHTDNARVVNLGQIKDNWDLSVLRATSVVRFLVDVQKIDPTRIIASGRGETKPLEMGTTNEARSKNRRIEIALSPQLDELFKLLEK